MIPEQTSNHKELSDIQKSVCLKVLSTYLKNNDWQKDMAKRGRISEFILDSLDKCGSRAILEAIFEMLEKMKFFDTDDLQVFYCRQLLKNRLNRFDDVINEAEDFRNQLSFVKKEHLDTYVKLLHILADAYFSSRLLSHSLRILTDIENITPGNTETYWQLWRVEKILGPEEGVFRQKEEKFALIEQSRFIDLASTHQRQIVYIADINEIKITIQKSLRDKIGPQTILQVFADGQILQETYLKDITHELVIKVSNTDTFTQIDLEIKII